MRLPVDFGHISAKYESGGRGVYTISSGRGDPGGVSYGKHQLASKTGTMAAFLKSPEAAPYALAFSGLRPGFVKFNEAYRRVAKNDPEGFARAQLEFMVRTHYKPVHDLASSLSFSVGDRRVQEALYSMSVQHGQAARIVRDAARYLEVTGKRSVVNQIHALYQARSNYVSKLSLPSATKVSLLNRYKREEADVLAMRDAVPPMETIQRVLKVVVDPHLKIDGLKGPRTEAAIRMFQQRSGLIVDGLVGPLTWAALEQTMKAATV